VVRLSAGCGTNIAVVRREYVNAVTRLRFAVQASRCHDESVGVDSELVVWVCLTVNAETTQQVAKTFDTRLQLAGKRTCKPGLKNDNNQPILSK